MRASRSAAFGLLALVAVSACGGAAKADAPAPELSAAQTAGTAAAAPLPRATEFDGARAWQHLERIVAFGNSVNLTDGLDGLATMPVIIACLAFMLIAYLVGNFKYAEYLGIPYVKGAGDLTVLCGAIVGAGLAFLWFNAPPAAVFMGDTGSLALGGTLGTIAVVSDHEFALAVIGGLFVVEALSVIIQVFWFKRTGRRIFRMAPIHHHFEQLGWSEPTVVIRFWIVSFVLALAGLSTLKLR